MSATSSFTPAIRDFLAAPDAARRLGPYRCTELLDKAGSAPVFRAREEHAGMSLREVAVKIFDIGKPLPGTPTPPPAAVGGAGIGASRSRGSRDSIAPGGFHSRVVDEARALCRVQHPNVIRFHTLSTDPQRGLMGLVMEFAEGVSVDRQLDDVPRGDDKRITLAVEVGINIASALAAAHEAGVVHCNVKPSNIMLTDGTHKLINFGIASALRSAAPDAAEAFDAAPKAAPAAKDREGLLLEGIAAESAGKIKASTLAKSGDGAPPLVGTIGYLDPVCLRTTAPPTPASDLYSLGATLYEIIAGHVPAAAGSTLDKAILTGDAAPKPLAEAAPNAPPELAKIVDALVAPARDARPRSADAVRRSLERIRSKLAGRDRALPPEDRGPFPGLDRYEVSDRDVFFGRSAEIAGVLELARSRGLVGIVGLSGTGKSSITRAGLVPAIEEGALGSWPSKYRSVVLVPGKDIMASLEEALSKVLDAPLADHPEAIAEQLAADVDAKGEGIVILVDQFEEIVTKHRAENDGARLDALDLFSRLAEGSVGVRVLVAVRRDLLDNIFAIDPHFCRALSRGVQLIAPLTSAQWEEVVDQSLEAYGYRFENDDLRRKVLDDIRTRESAMTLVQFGLSRLWAARDEKKKTIPRAAFDGGMQGSLERHADEAIAATDVPKDKVRDVLLALTTPEGTRTHVEMDVLVEKHGESAKKVVFALTKARLVVSEKEGFTFVHDSLLRDWKMLRGWIDSARDDRMLVAHIDRDAARWAQTRDPADHWRKGRLAAALELWKEGRMPLGDDARSFLASSAKEEQRAQLARWSVGGAIVLLIVFGALFYAKLSRDAAAQARRDADALAAALAEVKTLKHQAEENAMEAAASAKLLAELQKQMADERQKYGAKVQATLNKVATATSLDSAQKATEDLKAQQGPAQNQVVPLPADLSSLGGPSIPKPTDSGPSAGGGTFDSAAIERVVNSRKAGVKRTCLERSASTSSSTKVTATISIAPNGSVQNVSTTGDDPAVGRCIEQQLRTWSFPAPGEPKQVQIPFVFVRQ